MVFYPLSVGIPLFILLPNFLFLVLPAADPTTIEGVKKSKVLFVFEAIGRVGVMVSPLFSDFHAQQRYEQLAIIAAGFALVLYYISWGRYFAKNQNERLLYAPIFRIPIPLAIAPVLYFLFASLVLHSFFLGISAIFLAIGHLPSSWLDYQYIKKRRQD